jgi:hypothetical protein
VGDSQIIEHESGDEKKWLRDINFLATSENSAGWSKGTPEDWATESLQVAKEAYCLPGGQCGSRVWREPRRQLLPICSANHSKATRKGRDSGSLEAE